MSLLTVQELKLWQTGGMDFELLDVRRDLARAADATDIPGGRWLNPALWLDWKDTIGADRPVVCYCAHGHEISQGLTAALRAMGVDARHLVGGLSEWQAKGYAVVPAA